MKIVLGLLLIFGVKAEDYNPLIPTMMPLQAVPPIQQILGSTAPTESSVGNNQISQPSLEGQRVPQEQAAYNVANFEAKNEQNNQNQMIESEINAEPIMSQKAAQISKPEPQQRKESIIFKAIPGFDTILPGIIGQPSKKTTIPFVPIAVQRQPITTASSILGGSLNLKKADYAGILSKPPLHLTTNNIVASNIPNLRVNETPAASSEHSAPSEHSEPVPLVPSSPPVSSNIPNCQVDDGNVCLRCNKQTQLISGKCLTIPQNCKSIDVQTAQCLFCNQGFELDGGRCK